MSRRRKGRSKQDDSYVWWPDPPGRTVVRHGHEPCYERKPTEVHRAFMSFGADNQTHRLSDAEFGSQVVEEIGYLGCLSGAYFRRGLSTLMYLLRQII